MSQETKRTAGAPPGFLTWSIKDHIATVVMARPPVNAVNQQMYREIASAFAPEGPLATGAKAIVLTGSGRHFCAGNDLGEFATLSPSNSDSRMAEVRAAFFAIQDCPVPVLAAVRGAALGTGLAIAASCDFVIAGDSARFGTPEVGVGIMGGAAHLARLVPEPWVRWMYFTAEPVDAYTFKACGSVIDVVPDDELAALALSHAQKISRHSGKVLRTAKRALNAIETMDLQTAYTYEQSLTTELSGDADSLEARSATLDRRTPAFPSEVHG